MTTLFIRHPAKASIGPGSLPECPFALVGDGGQLLREGSATLSRLGEAIAAARRVVLLLAAADVTLLTVKVPPLSAARLKAALPALVEDQILADPADCALVAGPAHSGDATLRSVAVAQRAWIELLHKALLAQGAHSVSVLPAQLCLPLQPGEASAALLAGAGELELTLRQDQYQGLGLSLDLAMTPASALQTVRALAGETPVTVYVAAARLSDYQSQLGEASGITLATDHWAHWAAAARAAAPDLAPALGGSGNAARQWQRWRWPLRLGALALLVNIVAINVEWLQLKRQYDAARQSGQAIFKAAYPQQPMSSEPARQMRQNIAAARADGGQLGGDEFVALSAAFGEALATLARRDIIATLEYREHSLRIKVKPDTVDPGALAQLRSALAARGLALAELGAGSWQVSLAGGRKA